MAVALAVILIFFKKPSPDLAAKVGDQKITLTQVDKFANECFLEQKEATEYLVDDIVLSQWAGDEKITIAEEEQKSEEVRVGGFQIQPCHATLAKVNLFREKLSQNTTNFREGKFIVVNFGRFANPNPMTITEETSDVNRAQKLQEEKAYAQNLINSIYQDLKKGQLSFEGAIEEVNKDPKVGIESYYDTSFQSGSFTAEGYLGKTGLLADDSIRKKVDSLKEGEISEPFIGQADIAPCAISDSDCQPEYADARFLIAKVEKIGKGEGKEDEILSQTRQKYNAKIYLK